MQETPQSILSFWIDELGQKGWYSADSEVDTEITRRFGLLWEAAVIGDLDHWICGMERSLALLLITDQFSRNMHRGSGLAFATDGLARRVARTAVHRGWDRRAKGPERQFFYMPMMHSEFLPDQEQAVRWFMLGMGSQNLDHARAHRQIIRDFGRFPYRNEALGRQSTSAELTYLEAGGYRYTLNSVGGEG